MLRPLPQPTADVVEIDLGAGQIAAIESAPQITETLQEMKPSPEIKPIAQTPPEKIPVPPPVNTEVTQSAVVETPAPLVAQELEAPILSEPTEHQILEKPEVSAEEIREQVDAKLVTASQEEAEQLSNAQSALSEELPVVAAVATTPEVTPEVTPETSPEASPSSSTTGQGQDVQSSSPSPLKGELRSLAQLRQMPGNPKPSYDPLERKMGHSGAVVFKAFVTQEGRLTQFQMMQSTGHKNLDFKTLKALKQWKFYPGQQGWVELPFRWDLKGGPQEMPTQLRRRVGQN